MSSHRAVETGLMRHWMRRSWLACLLWPVSILFGAVAAFRRRLYRSGMLKSGRLPVPVIVVGNIFIGGTGKTPLTLWLVAVLREAGYTPGVISRGYGTKALAPRAVTVASLPAEVGDEPLLIAQRSHAPMMVGRNRLAAGKALLAAYPQVDIIVSDDGLQHYALQRDIELVLFDARGGGNGWLLPAGPLREPMTRQRDFTVINGGGNTDTKGQGVAGFAMQLEGIFAEQLADRSQKIALNSWAEPSAAKRIVAAAGIGNPGRFFNTLRAAGLRFDALPLPDHYDFSNNPFAGIAADTILITEKDAVKCIQFDHFKNDPRLWVVPVTACIDGPLAQQILEKCRGCSIA